jgi:hypothetical protein
MAANDSNYCLGQNLTVLTSQPSLGLTKTTAFPFGNDDTDEPTVEKQNTSTTAPDVRSYLQMNATDDKFPILVRRDDYPGLVRISQLPPCVAAQLTPCAAVCVFSRA